MEDRTYIAGRIESNYGNTLQFIDCGELFEVDIEDIIKIVPYTQSMFAVTVKMLAKVRKIG